jgi:hypothetical protein
LVVPGRLEEALQNARPKADIIDQSNVQRPEGDRLQMVGNEVA